MIEIVREFVVKEEARGPFELAYGPGGAWSNLFAGCPGFRGTTLLRDTRDPRRYLTIDLWDSEAHRDQALVDRETEYADMQAYFEKWTESQVEVGTFNVLAQATVRPRGKARRSSQRTSR